MSVKTACEREEVSFMLVEATVRACGQLATASQLTLLPSSINVIIWL